MRNGEESIPVQLSRPGSEARNVMLVMPWMKQTNPMTAYSVMGLADRRKVWTLLNFGDAFVAHTRNTCADLFLESGVEWMLTIDDDMVVPFGNGEWFNRFTGMHLQEPFASFNAVDRLMAAGKTLVGGLYFGKHRFGPPLYAEGMENPEEAALARRAPVDKVKPTRWVATGCLLVHRSVFLDIEKAFPRLARKGPRGGQWFSTSEHRAIATIEDTLAMMDQDPLKARSLLESGLARAKRESTLGMGEDVQFCIRAAQAGHQPHVDLGLVCGHVGQTTFGPHNTERKR